MLFFKQKTADGVRISDWSSYVCSSDLLRRQLARAAEGYGREISARYGLSRRYRPAVRQLRHRSASALLRARTRCRWRARRGAHRLPARSEEHTSELQSLMRKSYAVFCLNKKKT